jgi:uncharacterized protein YidB (DUF937 family)
MDQPMLTRLRNIIQLKTRALNEDQLEDLAELSGASDTEAMVELSKNILLVTFR